MWKDIKGFEDSYQIDENGKVKSLSRLVENKEGFSNYIIPERILKDGKAGRGYRKVTLRKDNKSYEKYVHRLVAEHFVDNPYEFPTVNHKDGYKENNYFKNLEWVSYSYNNQHSYDTGLHGRGMSHYNSKLRKKDVIEIIKKGKGNKTYQEIASKYGVTKATIRDILVGNTWKHIHTELEKCNDHSERKYS